MADVLHAALPRSALIKNTSVHRDILDMNRIESRGSEFRQKVSAALRQAILLIDVHSFPPGEFGGADVVIMEARRDTPSSAVHALLQILRRTPLRIEWTQAHPFVNDIEYSANVAIAFLLEVNEALDSTQLASVAKSIHTWLSDVK
jgi:hypothetical protein